MRNRLNGTPKIRLQKATQFIHKIIRKNILSKFTSTLAKLDLRILNQGSNCIPPANRKPKVSDVFSD